MKALFRIVPLTALLLAVSGCSSTKIVSSEVGAGVDTIDLRGQTVAALVINNDEQIRVNGENDLAAELTKRGMNGVSAHTFLPTSELMDREKAKVLIKNSGAQALVVVRVLDVEETQRYRPASFEDDYYGSMMSYYTHGWSTVNTPGYMESIETYTIETLCYRIEDEKLLWKGISKSINPASVKSLARELVSEAAKVMKKQGLVPGNR